MSSVLDRIRRQRQQTEQSEQASLAKKTAAAPTSAQVDAAAQATMSQNQIAPTGGSLVEKATSSVGLITDNGQFTATKPRYTEVELPGIRNNAQRIADRQKNRVSVDDRLAELYAQLENTPVTNDLNDNTRYRLKQEILQLEQEKEKTEKAKDGKQSVGKTVFDVVDRGAGYFNQGVANTADFVANLLPRAEGAFFGVDPEATFTGQVLKPVTNATGKLKDWVDKEVEGIDARIQNDTKDSKVAQTAANLGSQAVSILPNTLMALMSGGTSVAGQLATQGSGIAATTTSALKKMASKPTYWTSAAQSLGNNYEEAKASGATDEEAMTAALLSTAFNSAVEVGGGLEKLPDELIGADLSNGQKALQWLKSTLLEEPGEEIVQDVISGLTNAAVFDKDKPMFSTTDENAVINPQRMGKTYLESAAVSGLMGGGQVLASNAINQLASRNANTNTPQQTQANTPNEGMVAKMAQDVESERPNAQPVQVETPVAKTEDIMPKAAPAVDIDAAVNNVRAEGTGTVGDMGANPDDAKPAMGAADYGFSPYSNYQNTQSDFLPEGANAARPVDMPATDPTGKNTRRFAKTAAGAQVVPDRGVEQIERDFMDGKYGYEVKGDMQAIEKASALLDGKGFDYAYAQTVERLQDLKNLKQTVVDAQTLIARAYQDGRDADAAELCLLLAESGTEFGQATQAFSIFRKLTPEGQLEGVRRAVERINEKLEGKGKKTFAGVEIDAALVEKFRSAPDQQSRDAVMEEIYENIGKQIPTTFAEAANQWRYTAMLLNPSTHEKNISNNVSMMAMKLGKDALGAGIETVANAVTKGKTGRTKSILNVFSEADRNLMQTAWADFVNVEEDVKGIGKNKDNAMGKIGEHRDYWKLNNPETKVAKALDTILRTAEKVPKFNSDLMNLEDQWFSRPDYAISLAGYMKANNLTEITPEARLYAIKEAQKATFRDANAVSEFAMKMGTNGKWWNGIVNAIFPFKGTPANVGVRAVEYSPAGFLTTIGKAVKASKDGTFKATDFIDDLSANFVGTGLAVAGYFLAQAGLMRSTGVGDEKEKEAQKEAGYKDNSFKLFGYSVPETLITSVSTPMFVGAAVYEALATKALDGEAYTLDDVLQAMAATTDPLVGQTMLEGLNDTIYAIRRTQGGPGEWGAALAVNVAGNFIASFIPTLLSRISAAADGVSRETYVNKDSWVPDSVQKEIQDLMMKTPLRTKLPEKVDNYGRVQENWLSDNDTKIGKALGFVANVVTPTYPSEIKTTDVEAALQDVYRSGADTDGKKIFQTDAPKSIRVDGKDVNLTAKQYEHFEKVRGDNTMEYQGGLQNHELFSGLNGDIQAAATDKMYEYIEQISKADLGLGYEPENWVSELANATPDEVAREVIGKALDSVGGYGDKSTEDIYRKAIYNPAWSVVDEGVLDKAMEYATKFNDAEAKAKMGYEMDADWMLEAKAMGIHAGRTDYFIKKAVEAQAKKVGGTKYEGLEMLLESGEINGKAALLAMPDGAVDAYNEYCSGNYVTPEEWVDVYGYMNSLDGSGSENKEETLKYINGLKMAPNQKAALAQALYAANPDFIPKATDIPNEWLLDVGADNSVIVGQFSDSQKEAYSTYIEPAGVGMKWYLDAVEFNGKAKGDKNAKGETISGSKRDKVIKHIDSMNIDKAWKRAIYLSLGYSTKNMPRSWK